MVHGIDANRIIVGAYVDRQGGICPMLAAHREGGRTSLASFARAWDCYTGANGRPRSATERELRTLGTMLEASIAIDEQGPEDELAKAAAEHRAAKRRAARRRVPKPRRPRRDTGERDRTRELRGRPGWAWLTLFRRFDEYERAVAELEEIERERKRERELV
jgi:hypothetical protein